MIDAVLIVLPMFALMLCGYASVHLRLIDAAGVRGLATFVFYFAIPALLFRGIAGGHPVGHREIAIVYAYFSACLIVFFLTMAVGRLTFRRSLAEQAVMGFTASFSNTVLLGIPLIYSAFGDEGVLPVTLITSFHSIILLTLATTLIEIDKGAGGGVLRRVPETVLGLVRNPLLAAIIAGFAARFLGWHAPAAIDEFLKLLIGATAPCSLFALGGSLARMRIGGGAGESLYLVLMKMVGLPALVWASAALVFRLEPIQVAVATILAALPAGQNGFILAARYGVYVERSASIVLVTTAISVVTASLLVAHYAPLR